jgi:hypothetical protein
MVYLDTDLETDSPLAPVAVCVTLFAQPAFINFRNSRFRDPCTAYELSFISIAYDRYRQHDTIVYR